MIENYRYKKEKGAVNIEDNGEFVIAKAKRFDPETGEPEMVDLGQTNTAHLDDLIADAERDIETFQDMLDKAESKVQDLIALRADVVKLENERASKRQAEKEKATAKTVEK